MLVLAIESSTTSAKALLYDPEKGIVDSVQQSYSEAVSHGGRSDMEAVYDLTMQIAGRLAAGKDIEAIGMCGIWHSLGICGSDMRPVLPAFSWNFVGTAPMCEEIQRDDKLTESFYRRTGCMPHNTYPRHVVAYLKERGFDFRDKKLMSQGGYNFFRLTGEFLETPCIQSGNGLINLEKLDYDQFVLDYFGIGREQLGELVTYKEVCPLSAEGARRLGIKAGIPVVPAYADGALNQVGNYANRKGIMTMSLGTSGAIRMSADRPVLPEGRQLWCYRGAGHWLSGAAVAGACNCIDWFMGRFLNGNFSYAELEETGGGRTEEKETKSGGEDLPVFLPFLYGERCPGWDGNRRGGFFFIEGKNIPADFYTAVQMGILFNLYQCYEILCQENREPREIILSGGITNSRRWVQMAADIFQRDLLVANCPNASCMGAAALALHAAGTLEDIDAFKADYNAAVRVPSRHDKADFYAYHYRRYLKAYEKGL